MKTVDGVTVARVNNRLKELGYDERLSRGRGGDTYYYFYGGRAHTWRSSSVYVSHVSALTLAQWVGERARLAGGVL